MKTANFIAFFFALAALFLASVPQVEAASTSTMSTSTAVSTNFLQNPLSNFLLNSAVQALMPFSLNGIATAYDPSLPASCGAQPLTGIAALLLGSSTPTFLTDPCVTSTNLPAPFVSSNSSTTTSISSILLRSILRY